MLLLANAAGFVLLSLHPICPCQFVGQSFCWLKVEMQLKEGQNISHRRIHHAPASECTHNWSGPFLFISFSPLFALAITTTICLIFWFITSCCCCVCVSVCVCIWQVPPLQCSGVMRQQKMDSLCVLFLKRERKGGRQLKSTVQL